MKKILIPTDFSDNAGDALGYALHLVKRQPTEIHIVHVIAPIVVPGEVAVTTTPVSREQIQDATDAMEALAQFSKMFLEETGDSHISVTTSVAVGPVPSSLHEQADAMRADMIVMGTRGSSHGAIEKFIGTISTDVLTNSPCPVILVPRDYKFKAIDNVIYTTNLDHADPYEMWRATQLLSPHVTTVRCLYVRKGRSKVNSKEIETFGSYIEQHSPAIQTIFVEKEGEDIEATVEQYAEDYDAEMIIMHRSKKSLWGQLFAPRHTKRMVFWAKRPLMVLN